MTSTPAGARIIVDGRDRGSTPCTLKLATGKSHVVRIECEGYNPYEIRVVREKHDNFWGVMLNNFLLGGLAAGRPRLDVVEMEVNRLRDIKWIRVRKPGARQPRFLP
jgi:hypothetical protein